MGMVFLIVIKASTLYDRRKNSPEVSSFVKAEGDLSILSGSFTKDSLRFLSEEIITLSSLPLF